MSKHPLALRSAITQFIFHCQYEKNLNHKTLTAYRQDLHQFEQFFHADPHQLPLSHITPNDIRSYLKTISHYKPKTVKRKTASIKALFNYMEIENDDFHNPIHKLRIRIKVPLTLPNVLTADEMGTLLRDLYTQKRNATNTADYTYVQLLREIAIVELLFGTGLRVSELCSLTVATVDLSEGLVRVNGKGNRERVIQVCQQPILSALREYRFCIETQGRALMHNNAPFFVNRFGSRLDPQTVRIIIKRLAKRIGFTKRITPHTFRHTFATLLLEEGVDIKFIQTILGHSSLTTTQIYTHVSNSTQRTILRDFHPRRRMSINQSNDNQ